jgi:hypothetical protein
MLQMRESAVGNLDLAQATELATIIELEARWDNLRQTSESHDAAFDDLQGKQRAYEAYRSKLVAYNQRYKAGYEVERSVSTPVRMEMWYKDMQILYRQVENGRPEFYPVQLIRKAYRLADKLAVRLKKVPVNRTTPQGTTLRSAIEELEELARWCKIAAVESPRLSEENIVGLQIAV